MSSETGIRVKFWLLQPHLTGRLQRLWAAAEATAIGRGGSTIVSAATGISRARIAAGKRELRGKPPRPCTPSTRKRGGQFWEDKDPTLLSDLERLISDEIAGNPMREERWVRKKTTWKQPPGRQCLHLFRWFLSTFPERLVQSNHRRCLRPGKAKRRSSLLSRSLPPPSRAKEQAVPRWLGGIRVVIHRKLTSEQVPPPSIACQRAGGATLAGWDQGSNSPKIDLLLAAGPLVATHIRWQPSTQRRKTGQRAKDGACRRPPLGIQDGARLHLAEPCNSFRIGRPEQVTEPRHAPAKGSPGCSTPRGDAE
jgi:hypothetical protein